MKKIFIAAALLICASLYAQANKGGTISKIQGNEVIVKNENPDSPFQIGEKLHLLSGNKDLVLQVTFPMQSVSKCKVISGSISSLKIGAIVYAGETVTADTADSQSNEKPANVSGRVQPTGNLTDIKLDDFESFLGFTNRTTLESIIRILGKPSDISEKEGDKYCRWQIESHGFIYIASHNGTIWSINLGSATYDNSLTHLVYTTKEGTLHFLNAKGIEDRKLQMIGLSQRQIINILGTPDKIDGNDSDNGHRIWYSSQKRYIVFTIDSDNVCCGIHVMYN